MTLIREPVVTVQSYSPIPTRAAKDIVHQFAEHISQQLEVAPGDPVKPAISRLGGSVVYKDPIEENGRLPESIVVSGKNDFVIYLPSMTSRERDRFTMAHELGHYFLHYPVVTKRHPGARMIATRWVDERDADQQRAEWEANWFAAAFLMRSRDFRAIYRDLGGAIDEVAEAFGVSVPAAEIRVKTLGL